MSIRKLSALGLALIFLAVSMSITGADEIPGPMPQSLADALAHLADVRESQPGDTAALRAALDRVEAALADVVAGEKAPPVVRKRSAAPSPVPRERAYPSLPPTPETQFKATRRTHVTPPLPGAPSPTKPRKLTGEQLEQARQVVSRLRLLLDEDAAGPDIEAGLDELTSLIGR